MVSREYAAATRRAKAILCEIAARRQACLDELVRTRGVARIEVNVGPLVRYIWERKIRIIFSDGSGVVIGAFLGEPELDVTAFDPNLKELEEEFRALNKKFHMYP